MAERKVYLYRLNVTLPPGSDEPGWEPDGWRQDGWRDPNIDFRWPRVTRYLSPRRAERRAYLLRKYGATVVVERSEAVTWPGGDRG